MAPNLLFAAADLRMVVVDADLIALDLSKDEYLCLPGLGEQISANGAGWSAASEELFSGLLATGLFSFEPPSPRRSPPPVPNRTTLGVAADARRMTDDLRFLGAVLKYGSLAKSLTVHRLTCLARRPHNAPDHEAQVQRLAAVFARRLPWVPGQGECLYRAFLLRALLADAGVDVTWVFGVRTWPFAAHCWLQCGDLLLDDDLDRVRLYTPIHWVGP